MITHYTTYSSLHHYSLITVFPNIFELILCMSVQAIDTKGPIYVGLWAALSWGEKQAIQSIWEDPNHPIFPSHSLLHTFFSLALWLALGLWGQSATKGYCILSSKQLWAGIGLTDQWNATLNNSTGGENQQPTNGATFLTKCHTHIINS